MQYIIGVTIISLFGICFYGIIDCIKQINKIKDE